MSTLSQTPNAPRNRLLAALPTDDYQRLRPHLNQVTLSTNQPIYEAGEPIDYVYFPEDSIISLVSTLKDGSTLEVGLVGNEGMVGIPVIMSGITQAHRAFVQLSNRALQMRADVLKAEFDRSGPLQHLLLRYIQALLTQIAQSAVCNRFHTTEERLARWLLLVGDCAQSNEFMLTQEFIGQMLGVRRSAVTLAAGSLSQAGLIQYTRGRITICDRSALEEFSCECYSVVRDEFARLLRSNAV
jgi:CRP-like cAMP-binding protein